MSIFEDTNPRELRELLEQIHKRESALPDFQRDFVWEPTATQELIVSIASGYPAGSLLRIRNSQGLFACREFAGAPELDGGKPTFLILDGQQRLTSLYQAFFGVGEHAFFLDLDGLSTDKDFEDCIFHERTRSRRSKRLEKFELQSAELILPLSELNRGYGGFLEWMLKVTERLDDKEQRVALTDRLKKVGEKWIRAIDAYRFPVVTLSEDTTADAVCTIFETLNRTGVKLSVFELLTARFWPKKINLRDLWSESQKQYPIIQEFLVDPYYALQVASLAARHTPSCKQSDVLDLETEAITKWWDPAIRGLKQALEILRDDCGVLTPGWLPYDTILVPFAAVLARSSAKAAQVGAERNKLGRWFWCSVFSQAYDNAANSRAAADFSELLQWLAGGNEPSTVRNFVFAPEILLTVTPRQRAIYRACICLILSRGPIDFHKGSKLTGALIRENNLDDHHIFPRDYLAKAGILNSAVDCVVNRTLIDSGTNKSIQNKAPSKYMAEIRKALHNDAKFAGLLESHLLPTGLDSPLLTDRFDEFLLWRKEMLWEQIKAVTGITEASNEGAK